MLSGIGCVPTILRRSAYQNHARKHHYYTIQKGAGQMGQTVKSTNLQEPFVFRRRIGSTTFKVGIHFNEEARETINDKVLRMLKNDLQSLPNCATMKPLQAGWLPERGSL